MDTEEAFGISDEDLGNLKLLFAHPGWKVLVAQFTKNIEDLDTLRGVDNETALHYNKGQCAVLYNIVNLPDMVAMVEENDAVEEVIAH